MSDTFRPRRLRLTQSDFANYTGPIGAIEFVDGVSVELVVWFEALRVGSNIQTEDADEPGFVINPAVDYDRNIDRNNSDPICAAVDNGTHILPPGSPLVPKYTRVALQDIADKSGLAGVRDIARTWGRTGRSISECIEGIIEAQG